MPLLNTEQVKKILPHRDPFLFIDEVTEIDYKGNHFSSLESIKLIGIKELPGTTTIARYTTKPDHPIFSGHFPDYPILPGVVQIEMMAQAASFMVCMVYDHPFNLKMDVALLCVNEAKFRKPIFPGMNLIIKSTVEKIRGSMMTSSCQLFEGDTLMSEASVLATLKMD